MRFTTIALAAATLAATPAAAQDFTGPRLEANIGYDRLDADTGVAGAPDHAEGLRLGAAVGYDVALGPNFTIGAEAGIGWSLDDRERAAVGTSRVGIDSGRDIDVSLRLGARVAPRTLLYAKAGWANTRFEGEVRNASGALVSRVRGDEDGYRLGAGVEQALGRRLFVKGEYRYTNYGDDLERHQALVGFGVRF
ncbi:outer membrane protein [Sphingomonas lenta]|uniref:Opacity protein n=1 Tax=Sphingomonas lenta TaxID=1141887 RepID=A0A2A2SCY2_9SPHN|nr:porin family protein [Sphingomonas lenta]PAX07109.1 opacity protein [Sphingomonas lenta]